MLLVQVAVMVVLAVEEAVPQRLEEHQVLVAMVLYLFTTDIINNITKEKKCQHLQ
jgi:hypothetical protein